MKSKFFIDIELGLQLAILKMLSALCYFAGVDVQISDTDL